MSAHWDEDVRRANHARLEEFLKRLRVLCTEFQVQILAEQDYDAYVVLVRTGKGSTEVDRQVYSDGTIFG